MSSGCKHTKTHRGAPDKGRPRDWGLTESGRKGNGCKGTVLGRSWCGGGLQGELDGEFPSVIFHNDRSLLSAFVEAVLGVRVEAAQSVLAVPKEVREMVRPDKDEPHCSASLVHVHVEFDLTLYTPCFAFGSHQRGPLARKMFTKNRLPIKKHLAILKMNYELWIMNFP